MKYSELKELLSEKTEGLIVEFKSEISDPHKFAKAVAAIANASGGRIYVGVDEDATGKPIIQGVRYDRETHNKERMTNIISDRIAPKIPGLDIDVVSMQDGDRFVFVISIPMTPFVHGVKDDGRWEYYIRRPARTDELAPADLMELSKQKNSYKDNLKTRLTLLDTARVIKKRFAEMLDASEQEFLNCLHDPDKFRNLLRKAKMKNLAENFVDEFYGLQRGVKYALHIPHKDLTVEEQECLNDVNEAIKDYAYGVGGNSSLDIISLHKEPQFTNLSVAEWFKYAVNDMDEKIRKKIWQERLMSMFSSYDTTFDAFLQEAHRLGIPSLDFYEEQFSRHLREALQNTCNALDRLIDYYETIQTKFGAFQRMD